MTPTSARAGRLTGVREAAYRRLAGGYAADPVGYAEDVLGAALTPDQRAMPGRLLAPPYRLLCPSANKVGKTFAAGWLINWFHDSFDPGVCLVTSATARSVKTQVFKEVRKLRPYQLGLKPRAPEIVHHDTHQVLGFSTTNPDAFQGQHEGHWMLLYDEATAVPQVIWDRSETMFSGVPGHAWVCFYNPNDPTSPPFAAEQSGGWSVQRLSALTHPNVLAELRGEPPPFPGAVRLHRVRQRIAKECEECGRTEVEGSFEFPGPDGKPRWYKPVKPEFNPQVRGRWPDQAMNAVWSAEDRRRCERAVDIDPTWPVQVGLDCARFGGDRWVFAVRKGVALVHLEERTDWPTRHVSRHAADRLRELCDRYAPPGVSPKLVPCAVDDSGGYGSGVVDHPDGYTFVGVVAAEKARDPARYATKRAELWFRTLAAADGGGFFTGCCREGRHLVEQLWREMTAVRYSLDKKGRRVVEGKDTIKDRLKVSPDLPDGVNLAWYPIAA